MSSDRPVPGLKARPRATGSPAYYWCATPAAVKAGFTPRTVRLHYPDTPEGRAEMEHRCNVLQATMLEWISGRPQRSRTAPAGTISWLIEEYQADEDSPFHGIRQTTRINYLKSMAIIDRTVGARRVNALTGRDIRRWHKEWSREGESLRRAHTLITMLRILFSYGTSLRDTACMEMKEVLSSMDFALPPPRENRMTFAQAVAIRKAAHEIGHPEVALAVALQFELGLRQRDVLGEWIPCDEDATGIIDHPGRLGGQGGHQRRPKRFLRWDWGLTWSHISADMILTKPTSKSNGRRKAVHDLKLHPEVMAELARVPPERRIGPVVFNPATGIPFRQSVFSVFFRQARKLAGVPENIWNMDARAGAVSEAYEAGAEATDVMKYATHDRLATSMRYNRSDLTQTSRVAVLRGNARGTGPRNE